MLCLFVSEYVSMSVKPRFTKINQVVAEVTAGCGRTDEVGTRELPTGARNQSLIAGGDPDNLQGTRGFHGKVTLGRGERRTLDRPHSAAAYVGPASSHTVTLHREE